MKWAMLHPRMTLAMLGYLPEFLSENDPRPAREQLDSNYQHGGGWRPFNGFTIRSNGSLKYPGDQELRALARTQLRDETITFYECSWVSVMQPDGTYEIARMD